MLHLIHPALLHFTVAFVTAGGVCEIAGWLSRREALSRFGGLLLLIGLASLVPTVVSGYLAANTVSLTDRSRALLERHEACGWYVLGVLFGAQFWKAWCRGRLGPRAQRFYIALIALVVLCTIWGAWLGGQMVYLHGVGVR